MGYVVELGGVVIEPRAGTLDQQQQWRDASAVYSLDPDRDEEIKQLIDEAGKKGDTLGGVVEVRVEGVPFGLGTHAQWDLKLDGRLGYTRPTNNAGGLEAGMTNGQPLVVRAAKKPISTLRKPLESINLATKEPQEASYERSDICAVPAASVIVENVVAFEVARALVEKFGGDSLLEMKGRWDLFQQMARDL